MTMERDSSSRSPTASAHPKQLSDADSVFISVDSPIAASHIAALTIIDPSSSSEFSFERYLGILRERIELVARFKWRLFQPSLGFDRAYWVEVEDFDIRDHVERLTIRAPGDRKALAQLASELHAESLDHMRPLWRCWWIDGLEGDRVALLLKIHHCLMDGQSSVGLSEILLDVSPEASGVPLFMEQSDEPRPRAPTLAELGLTALANGLRRPQAIAVHGKRALLAGLGRILDAPPEIAPPTVPRVSFNGRLSSERAFAFASIPFGPLRDARKHFDVTLNDVILEIVSSSVRQALIDRDGLPESPLVGLCPVSLRQEGDQGFANQISSMPVALATDLEDVPSRLAAIHADAEAAKRRLAHGAFEPLAALGECLVPGALKLLTRVAQGVPSMLPLPANLVISNVRGLPVPLYLAGGRVEEIYPISMLQVGNGLNVTAVSHEDKIDFGFLTDPTLADDPWVYARGVHRALAELEQAIASRSKSREEAEPTSTAHPPESGRTPKIDSHSDDDPLDLQLIIAELGHIQASRVPRDLGLD